MPGCFEDDPVAVPADSPVKRRIARKRPPLPVPVAKRVEVIETREEVFARLFAPLDATDFLPIGKMKAKVVEQAALMQIHEGNLAVKVDQKANIEEILK